MDIVGVVIDMARRKKVEEIEEETKETDEEEEEETPTITDGELKKWSKKKYPDFYDRLDLMRKCWEREQGIVEKPKDKNYVREYVKKNVKDVKNRENAEVEVLIASKKSEYDYRGCSKHNCRKKKDREVEDEHYVCQCGNKGLRDYTWHTYYVGDKTGDIIAKTNQPAEEEELLIEGKLMKLRGWIKSDKFDGGSLFLSVNEVVNGGKTKSNEKLEKTCSDVADFLNLYKADGGLDEKEFEKWFKKQKYGVSLTAVLDTLNVEEEDGKLIVVGD